MPILAKYRGVHLSNYEDLKWTKDTRAPYYYYAAIPYYVAAIDFLLSDNTLSEDVKKELVRKKEMAELFFRFFLANPENSVLIHNDLSNDNVHYSYTSLLGLGVLSLTESCPEIEGAHVRQIFRNGRPDDAILRGLMPGVTRVNLAPPVSVEEHSAQEFKAELEKVERENSP